ncbi:MAG: hypothetical protein IE881_03680 [Epsilonproteobacteria bacterium]|nr:hypothetical protein [Campylobacterota bacterium]
MKKISIISILTMLFLSEISAKVMLDANQIKSMVSAIKMERLGTDAQTLQNTPSPFRIPPPKKVVTPASNDKNTTASATSSGGVNGAKVLAPIKKAVVLKLDGISNNTAFINGKWYRVGMVVEGFSVVSISKSSVVLKNKNQIKSLSISKINPL